MPRRAPTPKHKPQSTDGPTQLELERDATLGEFMAKGVPLEDEDLLPVLVDIAIEHFGATKKGRKRDAVGDFFKNLFGGD